MSIDLLPEGQVKGDDLIGELLSGHVSGAQLGEKVAVSDHRQWFRHRYVVTRSRVLS